MGEISKKARQIFERWGRKGGKMRARWLSPDERSAIATNAARTRWNKQGTSLPSLLPSIRLKEADLSNPVYLAEILSDGTWGDWKRLYQIISDRPFGETAIAVEKVCFSAKMYGISALWGGILRSIRGGVL